MISISRRGFVISAAAAGAAFGLDGPLEFVRPVLAQGASEGAAPGFAKFKVGDWTVTSIYDGIWEKPHDPGFIKNASLDDTKAALKAGGLTDAHVPITFTVTVAEKDGKIIMFDSGTGGQLSPKAGLLARENLKSAGIDAARISTIVVTHFHPDHIFGLMAKETNAPVFPSPRSWCPKESISIGPIRGLSKRCQPRVRGWRHVSRPPWARGRT